MDDLLKFVQKASEGLVPKIEEDLGSGFVRLHITEAEKRQARQDIQCVEDAARELIRNSRDSGARTILVALSKSEPSIRKITVIDDGSGIPPKFHKSIFESRITSRLAAIKEDAYGIHGRGMALFSIFQRTKECRVMDSAVGSGSIFEVVFDLSQVRERSDQSSVPRVVIARGKRKLGRGPHNIKRVLMQFALDHPELRIFTGSQSEIFSTIVGLSREREKQPALFGDREREDTIWRSGIHLFSPKKIMELARDKAGFDLSLRNCQRIISGELTSLEPLLSMGSGSQRKEKPQLKKLFASEPLSARIPGADIEEIKRKCAVTVSEIGGKYFLDVADDVLARRSGSAINLTFNFIDSDEKDGL